MKKIGILSDTHSFLDTNLRSVFEDCDEIWHAGDIGDIEIMEQLSSWKPVRAVYGNIDDITVREKYPEYMIVSMEKTEILLVHIAGPFGNYNQKITNLLKQNPKIACIICGHSHILKVQYDNRYKLLYINPGAAGKHGFHQMRTALKLNISDQHIHNLQLVELGKRGKI